MTKRNLTAAISLSLLCVSLASCTSRKAEGDGQAPTRQGQALTIKGSDTLVLLAQRLAERYMDEHPETTIQVTGGGSGTGIAALINGTTAVATASRPMKDAEKELVQARRGKPAVETAVALDGIAVYVHESNPVDSLTLAQIRKIYEGEIRNWKEVGGPDGEITLYSRENNSGTYAYFKEEVLQDEDFAAFTQTLPGTAAVVNAVAKDPLAIGYGGIAYSTGVKAIGVSVAEGQAPVRPTLQTVTDGSYPISRKLFFYTAGQPEGAAAGFIEFALSPEGQQIATSAGYYPLSAQKQ